MPNNKKWYMDGGINKKNLYVLSILRNYCPSYARHMFSGNTVLEAFYLSDKGGINPMDMPVCSVCQRPGVRVGDPTFDKLPDKYDSVTGELVERINCYCDLHGITYDTKDLRHYLLEDLNLNPEVILKIEMALYQ